MTDRRIAARRPTAFAMALLFVLMTAVIAVRTARNLNVAGRPDLPGDGLHDFRDVFYYPVVAVLDGRNPYDAATFRASYPVARPFAPYAPTTLLLHLPLGLLPYGVAEWTYFALNAALVLLLASVCLRACRLPAGAAPVLGLGALVLLSRPAHMTLYIGQCAVYLVIATYVALLRARDRPLLAGVALAVACVKPTFGVPLALLMVVRRDWRALAAAALIGGALAAVATAVLVHAAGGVGPLIASVRESYPLLMRDPSANAASSIIRLDVVAFLGRFAGRALGGAADPLITVVILAAGAIATASVMRMEDGSACLWSTCVAALTILASMYHQAYDGLLLTLPLLALATGRIGNAASTLDGAARWVAFGAMLVPAFNYLATDTFVDALALDGVARTLVASSNGAAVLLAFAALVTLALRASSEPRAGRSLAPRLQAESAG